MTTAKVRNIKKGTDFFTLVGLLQDSEERFIDWVLRSDPRDDLTVYLNSMGGEIPSALAMIAAIRVFQKKAELPTARGSIIVHVLGDACSVAAAFVQAFDWRVAEPSSFLMLHPITAHWESSASELRALISSIDHETVSLVQIIAARACEDLDEDKAKDVRQSIANALYGSGPVLSGNAQAMYFMGFLDEVNGGALPSRADMIAKQREDEAATQESPTSDVEPASDGGEDAT